jgi:replicative DNA helicase
MKYLPELVAAPSPSSVALYEAACRKLMHLSRLRVLGTALRVASAEVFDAGRLASNDYDWPRDVWSRIGAIVEDLPSEGWTTAAEASAQAMEHTRRAHDHTILGARGLTLPWPTLQKHTGGLFLGETYVITAETGGGKTLLAGELAAHIAETSGFAAGVWSLEMPPGQLMSRLAVRRARINATDHRNGVLDAEAQSKHLGAMSQLAQLPMFFDGKRPRTGQRSITSILATMQHYARKAPMPVDKGGYGRPLGVMVLDYAQKVDMSAAAPHENREQQLNRGSDMLKRAAEELNVALVLICQENKEGKIRDAAAVEFHIENRWRLKINARPSANPMDRGLHPATIDIGKARHGAKGRVPMWFDPHSVGFE